MQMINRAAIVVRPQQPFFDWAASLEGGYPEGTEPWTSVYLVEAAEDQDPAKILRRHFAAIFDEQLEAWHLVVDDWPASRTFAMFQKWFAADVVGLVYDISKRPLMHED